MQSKPMCCTCIKQTYQKLNETDCKASLNYLVLDPSQRAC
jgi:hypothetical protein